MNFYLCQYNNKIFMVHFVTSCDIVTFVLCIKLNKKILAHILNGCLVFFHTITVSRIVSLIIVPESHNWWLINCKRTINIVGKIVNLFGYGLYFITCTIIIPMATLLNNSIYILNIYIYMFWHFFYCLSFLIF